MRDCDDHPTRPISREWPLSALLPALARFGAPFAGHLVPLVELARRQDLLQLAAKVFLHRAHLAAPGTTALQRLVVGVLVADGAQLLRFFLQQRAQLGL